MYVFMYHVPLKDNPFGSVYQCTEKKLITLTEPSIKMPTTQNLSEAKKLKKKTLPQKRI